MKVIVSTHQGQLLSDDADYIVCKNENGQFAIFKNHIPTISVIGKGLIRLNRDKDTLYVAINNGILEFKENTVTVIAQGAFIGRDEKSVKKNLEKVLKEQLEANRKTQVDFASKEKDLMRNIQRSKAGEL